ncbi:MAG TPA: hypothetical protein VEQ58_17005 [Polyangiaceae bacterium]|nr:hypothetical protein [Polyangiaceae bacterium]
MLLPGRVFAQATPDKPLEGAAPPSTDASAAKKASAPAGVVAKKPPPSAPPKRAEGQLSDEAELSRVAGLYEAGKYFECSSELERLLDPTGHTLLRQPAIVENARVYWAACLLGAGESEAADAPLRAAIHENPQMKPPDTLVFPQPVIERFLKVRDSLVSEIRAAEQARILQAQALARQRQQALARDRDRMLALEKLAQQETIIVKNRRTLALVPFGVGQFQNREPGLGFTLLVSEAVLSSLSLTAIIVQSRLQTQADELRRSGGTVDEIRQQRNQRTWSTVKTGAFWAFAALAVGGIAQAQLEFVPEFREQRRRQLPPALGPSPAAKPSEISATPYFDDKGGGLSVMGRF